MTIVSMRVMVTVMRAKEKRMTGGCSCAPALDAQEKQHLGCGGKADPTKHNDNSKGGL